MKIGGRKTDYPIFLDLSGASEAEEELAVAVAAMDRAVDSAEEVRAGKFGEGEGADLGEDAGVDSFVADDAAAAIDLGFAGLELGFHESDEQAAGGDARPDGGEDGAQGDEREVHDNGVEGGAGQIDGGEVAGVDLLEIGDPGIGAEFGVELGTADIDADDGGGAGLEGAIGETAGGSADVEHVGVGQGEREVVEETLKFLATAGDEARGLLNDEFEIGGEFFARFVEARGAVEDAAGHDEGLGLRAGIGEAAGN